MSILALGPLTNIALAMQLDSSIAENAVRFMSTLSCHFVLVVHGSSDSIMVFVVTMQAEIVVLGGAFFVNGNVNPAGESQMSLACSLGILKVLFFNRRQYEAF